MNKRVLPSDNAFALIKDFKAANPDTCLQALPTLNQLLKIIKELQAREENAQENYATLEAAYEKQCTISEAYLGLLTESKN